jgi:hypothetical protein
MATLKATPRTFSDALQFLGSKSERTLGNNTTLHIVTPDSIAVRLHATDIVTFHRDGRVILNTFNSSVGRTYRTVTTKERINQFIDGRVYAQQREWYFAPSYDFDKPVEFSDGMNVGTQSAATGV